MVVSVTAKRPKIVEARIFFEWKKRLQSQGGGMLVRYNLFNPRLCAAICSFGFGDNCNELAIPMLGDHSDQPLLAGILLPSSALKHLLRLKLSPFQQIGASDTRGKVYYAFSLN